MADIGYLLLGAVIWQMLVFIALLISGEDEEMTVKIAMIVPYTIFSIFAIIYKKVVLSYYQKNYSLCSLWKKQEKGDHPYFGGIAIKNKDIGKYYHEDDDGEYYINVYQDGKNFKSIPYEKMTKIRKNGWFCQKWVDENFLKK